MISFRQLVAESISPVFRVSETEPETDLLDVHAKADQAHQRVIESDKKMHSHPSDEFALPNDGMITPEHVHLATAIPADTEKHFQVEVRGRLPHVGWGKQYNTLSEYHQDLSDNLSPRDTTPEQQEGRRESLGYWKDEVQRTHDHMHTTRLNNNQNQLHMKGVTAIFGEHPATYFHFQANGENGNEGHEVVHRLAHHIEPFPVKDLHTDETRVYHIPFVGESVHSKHGWIGSDWEGGVAHHDEIISD